MRLICPSCGAMHSADGWAENTDARQCFSVISGLPMGVSRQGLSYLALFRPGSGRGLAWSKALKLLLELKTLVEDGFISWKKNPARPNDPLAWSRAMERVIANPPRRLPLKSHGYLRSVAWEIADEIDRANEVRRNAAERSGNWRAPEPRKSKEPEPVMTVEEMRAIKNRNMPKGR